MTKELDFLNSNHSDYSFTKPLVKAAATGGGIALASQAKPFALAAGMVLATAGAPVMVISIGMGAVYYTCITAPTTIPTAVDMLYEYADKSATEAQRADLRDKFNQLCTQYNNDQQTLRTKINELFLEHGITQAKLESAIDKIDFQNYMLSTMARDGEFYAAMDSFDRSFNLACFVFPKSKIIARARQTGHIGTQAAKLCRRLKDFNRLSAIGKASFAADFASLGLMIIELFSSNDSALIKKMEQLLESIEALHQDVMEQFADIKHMLNEIYREVLAIKWAVKDIDALLKNQTYRLENIVLDQSSILRAAVSELTEALVFNASKRTLLGRLNTNPDNVLEDDLLTTLRDCYAWGLEHAKTLPTLTGCFERRYDPQVITNMLKSHSAKHRIGYLGRHFYQTTQTELDSNDVCNPEALVQAAESFVHILGRYHATRHHDFLTILVRQFFKNKGWLLYMSAIMLLDSAASRSTHITKNLLKSVITSVTSTVFNAVKGIGYRSTIPSKDAIFFCGVAPFTGIIGCAVIEKRRHKLSLTSNASQEVNNMLKNYCHAIAVYYEFIKSIQIHPVFLHSKIKDYDQAITDFKKTLAFDNLKTLRAQIKNLSTLTNWPDQIQKIESNYWLCRRFIELAYPLSSISDPLLRALFSEQGSHSQGYFSAEMLIFQLQRIEKEYPVDTSLQIACHQLFRTAHLYTKLLEKIIGIKQKAALNSNNPIIECDEEIVEGAAVLRKFSQQYLGIIPDADDIVPLAGACITTVDAIANDLDPLVMDDIAIAIDFGKNALELLITKGAKLTPKTDEGGFLHIAAYDENLSALKRLLKSGLPVDHVDSFGNNALHYATAAQSFLAIPFLVEADVNQKKKNHFGEIPRSLLPAELHNTFDKCVNMCANGQLKLFKAAEQHLENNEPADALQCYKQLLSGDDKALMAVKNNLERAAKSVQEHKAAIANPKQHHYSKKAIPGLQTNLEHHMRQQAYYQELIKTIQPELPEPWKLYVRKQLNALTQSLQALENYQKSVDEQDDTLVRSLSHLH